MSGFVGVELQPEVDEGQIRVNVELEPGTRVEVTDTIMRRLGRIVREKVPEASYIMVEAGSNSTWRAEGTNRGQLRIDLVEQKFRERSAAEIARELRRLMQVEPGMIVRTRVSSGLFRRGMGEGDRLSVEVRGHDIEVAQKLAERVQEAMASIAGVTSSQVSRRPGMPEMLISVDRAKATSMGLSVSEVADTLETAIGGTRASLYREEGDEYDIVVRLREEDRLKIDQVAQVPITLPDGRTIPAESIVRMRRQEGPVEITRSDQQRIVTVDGTIADRDLGSIVGDLRASLSQIEIPTGYEVKFGGEYEEQQEAFLQMTFAAILALLLVYMVMASQFESLRDPFIILFSIPLAFVGIVLVLFLTATTFNIQGFLGVIVLVGIVVNNAIVLVDYTNRLRREGAFLGPRSGRHGRQPPAEADLDDDDYDDTRADSHGLGIGEGGELQAPLARVVIGGLCTSTLITLVFIPIVYMTFEERTERASARQPTLPNPSSPPAIRSDCRPCPITAPLTNVAKDLPGSESLHPEHHLYRFQPVGDSVGGVS